MITQQEFETILADTTKRIDGDVQWREDEDHSPAREFRVELQSESGWPIVVIGRYNAFAGTLSYVLVHRSAGRIYGLDLGADHHNPTCERVGEKHKHRWTESFRDKEAYIPDDISATWNQPMEVWQQFCHEAKIEHRGQMHAPSVLEELPV